MANLSYDSEGFSGALVLWIIRASCGIMLGMPSMMGYAMPSSSFISSLLLPSYLSGFLDSGHTRTSSRASSNGGLWLSFTASQQLLCRAPTFRSCTADTDLWTAKTPVPRVLKTWDMSDDRGALKTQLISRFWWTGSAAIGGGASGKRVPDRV